MLRPISFQNQIIDSANNQGGFLVNDPVLRIIRVLDVPVRRRPHGFPGVAFDLIADTAFLADIPGVPLIEQVTDGGQLIFTFSSIDIIRNGHQADVVFREELLHKPSHFNVVTAQPGKVLDKQSGCLTFFQLTHHLIKAGAVHGDTGNTVVNESNDIGIAHVLCHLGQQLLLIADTVAFPFQIIVTGQAGVDERGNVACFLVVRLFHKSSF